MLLAMVALGAGLFFGGGFAVWWLDQLIKNESDLVLGKTAEQLHKLSQVSTELHHTRAEVTRVHKQVEALRKELDAFAHGPPSLRAPAQQAS